MSSVANMTGIRSLMSPATKLIGLEVLAGYVRSHGARASVCSDSEEPCVVIVTKCSRDLPNGRTEMFEETNTARTLGEARAIIGY